MKMFNLVERKEEYEKIVSDHAVQVKQIKSPQQQYLEEATIVLNCTAKTKSVALEYFEWDEEHKKNIAGSTTRKNCYFYVNVQDNKEFIARKADLLDEKKYKIQPQRFVITSAQK